MEELIVIYLNGLFTSAKGYYLIWLCFDHSDLFFKYKLTVLAEIPRS